MTALSTPSPPEWARSWVAALIPEEIRSFTPARSSEVNQVFRVEFESRSLFLKIGLALRREYERLRWLDGRQPCPQPVGFTTHDTAEALLMSFVPGMDLADLAASLPPQVILTRLATALTAFHATPIADWPFDREESGKTLVHGDACLPNFLYRGGRLSGFIDLGDMTIGAPEIDLSAAIWSLQYNLGPGYGLAFLHAYGVKDAEEALVERLRLRYEAG